MQSSFVRITKTLVRLQDAQADVNLRWAHKSEGTFSHVATPMIVLIFIQSNLNVSNTGPMKFV